MDGALTAEAAWWECDTLLPWPDSSPSGLVTESFPPKSELHSDRRSSILLGMSSEVALIPAAAGGGRREWGRGQKAPRSGERDIYYRGPKKRRLHIERLQAKRPFFSLERGRVLPLRWEPTGNSKLVA